MDKHWRTQVIENTPEPRNVNPRLAQHVADFQFDVFRAAKEHWVVFGPDKYWHERDIITEHGYRPPRKRRCHHHNLPTPNTTPSPTPLTKSLSNLHTALLLLYRWFNLPILHLATILNHTFATGLNPTTTAMLIRAAKLNRSPEYIDVFENTTWFQRRRHHADVFHLVRDTAIRLDVALVPRTEDIEVFIVDRKGRDGRGKGV
jgi:hypothetical protein